MTAFNGKSETFSAPPPESVADALLDGWREALGEVLAGERKQWERERALIEAQAQRTISELRATIAVLRADVLELVREKLAEVKSGERGPAGERGEKGEQGEQGIQGERGESGERGDTGEQGQIGPIGERGEPGPAGEQGQGGPAGPAGEPGAAGGIGERGERGEPGERGADGGTGPQGDVGLAGQKGDPGDPGEQGIQGDRGEKGEQGLAGLIGKAGEIGPRGDPGEKGLQGDRGEQGERGPVGLLPVVKLYELGAVHYAAQVVCHTGGLWQAQKDTGHAPPHGDWLCLARAGADGISPTVRGTYREDENYSALDIVAYNKGSFIARKDRPGPIPGDGWQLLTAHGGRGEKGVQGPRGERGPSGPGIARWLIDRRDYTAKPVLSDGSEGAEINLRELFEQFQSDAG